MDNQKAKDALLTENYRHFRDFSSGTPARTARHPFKKALGSSPKEIIQQWKGKLGKAQLIQSCPDFALKHPYPHKIVFEAKYFSDGNLSKAETELVTDIYQAFFYRGLPYVQETKTRPAWDYDYACLFAYDASQNGSLKSVWESSDREVKKGFWEGASLFVMILRGHET